MLLQFNNSTRLPPLGAVKVRRHATVKRHRALDQHPDSYWLLIGARQCEVEAQIGGVGRPELNNLAHVRVVNVGFLWGELGQLDPSQL